MTVVCPSCGKETPGGFPRCANCGAPLTAAAPAREERKVVTVLFCDLVGSTARAEGADPEDVRALLSAYHERVRRELERFGGTVEKFIGDAVMALFGAPTAHEDDPERAVRAALAIRDWAQEQGELQIRIGITTGEALVSLAANPQAGEGMASGDVVNTAARLQSAARVNGIVVDETTYRAASHVVDFDESEPVAARGKSRLVAVWQAVAARSRLGVDVRQHGVAPLVGRERELELLTGTLERVRENRSPQLITLVGPPGIGKSRLVFELMQRLEQIPELVTWRQGRSLPYGGAVSLWALSEIVKAQAGILESDAADRAAAKLRRAVEDVFPLASGADWIEGHLRPLVGLGAEGELSGGRQDEAFAAWRGFFESLAERRPLVLAFEDLQWADEALLDFIDHLVDWASGVPLLVLCTARPELLDRRPEWGGGKLNASTQALSPLGERQTARLIGAVLEQALLPAETQTTLLERAGGNPLYAEQFARLYVERGTAENLPLPETVQGIIGARLDTLPHEDKGLLQDASVIGKVFWTGALRGDSGRLRHALHALERTGFVRRQRSSSVEGEEEYAFTHFLVREVAYGQIPRALRAEKHRLAAEWIESLGRPEDHAELLAHHYSAALELARAAGEETATLAERTRFALRAAGDRAYALNSFATSARLYGEAVELWPVSDRDRPALLLRYGQARRLAELGGEAELLEARDAFLAVEDRSGAAEAEAALGELLWEQDEAPRAAEHVERAAELARGLPASPAQAYVLAAVSRFWTFQGREDEAIRLGRQALSLAEDLSLEELRAHALDSIGTARVLSGDLDGLADVEQSLEIALALNSRECLRAYNNLVGCVGALGDLRRERELIEEGLRVAERFGSAYWTLIFRQWSTGRNFQEGEWDQVLRVADDLDAHFVRLATLPILIRLGRGDVARAVDESARNLEEAHTSRGEDPETLSDAFAMHGCALLAAGRQHEAVAAADALMEVLTSSPGALNGMVVTSAAALFAGLGRTDQWLSLLASAPRTPWTEAGELCALGEFERAADVFAEIGARYDEAIARLRAAERLVSEERPAEADRELRKALAFFRKAKATAYIHEAEALLAKSA
jgi:class 3 adenylate cyclase/tetratricopeptide (TPR) repeat protein